MADKLIEQTRNSVYYDPKPDITVFELACCLGILLGIMGTGGLRAEGLIREASPQVQRHFRIEP